MRAGLLALCLAGASCLHRDRLPSIDLQVGGHTVRAEVADSMDERSQGLMYREELGADRGMLFVYPDVRPRSFWMANTTIPLSIAFIDERGVIFRIRDMVPLDRRHTRSGLPARYALEMNQGWFEEHGVDEGAQVEGLPGPAEE
jgi:uncharacterized membrane protein (UPF0127 family)